MLGLILNINLDWVSNYILKKGNNRNKYCLNNYKEPYRGIKQRKTDYSY